MNGDDTGRNFIMSYVNTNGSEQLPTADLSHEGLGLMVLSLLVAFVQGQLLKDWGLAHNAAAAPPQSPLNNNGSSTLDPIVLLPFGSTCLRMAEMPTTLNKS